MSLSTNKPTSPLDPISGSTGSQRISGPVFPDAHWTAVPPPRRCSLIQDLYTSSSSITLAGFRWMVLLFHMASAGITLAAAFSWELSWKVQDGFTHTRGESVGVTGIAGHSLGFSLYISFSCLAQSSFKAAGSQEVKQKLPGPGSEIQKVTFTALIVVEGEANMFFFT